MTADQICTHRVSIITGHYGTGKTEFAVNLALQLAACQKQVMLADLDIVNPYFRSRERKAVLENAGIRLVASSQACTDADVPALPAELLTGYWPASMKRSRRRTTSSSTCSTPTGRRSARRTPP